MAARTLDFGQKGALSGIIGRPRTLAWPVYAYRITMPARSKSGGEEFNPFERVIVNLLSIAGSMDESALAKDICIPIDLVRNVLFRLRDRGLIDEDNRLINAERAASREHAREEQYVTALVFRELVGGSVLPFVMSLDDGNTLKTKTADEYRKPLPQGSEPSFRTPPSPRDIIAAVTQMARRSSRRTLPLLHDQVRIGREPEEFFLECDIVIQIHDADFRIGSPWGDGFSRILETAFTGRLDQDQKLQQWMLEWRNQLAAPNNAAQSHAGERAPFDTPDARRRYPKLIHLLTPPKGETYRSLPGIYHSLEWALFYTCKAYDTDIAIRRLSLETGPEYSQWMSDLARTMGFDVPAAGFRPVLKGRLIAFTKSSEADMETVVAICLLQAEGHADHPLRRVAAAHPDFLVRLWSLKKDRDGLGHGRLRGGRAARTAPLESDAFMQGVVRTLLPSILFDQSTRGPPSGSQADRRLDARTSLLSTFGHSFFGKLGPNAQEALLRAELFWLVCRDGDDAREFVFNIYPTLQGLLFRVLSGIAPSVVPEDGYRALASERSERAGLGRLPPELETVNLRRVRETLQGNDRTLGASALALLLKASDEFLESLARDDPRFLTTIATIHAARGHGNEPVPMSKDDVAKLRLSAFASIEALLTNED
jgi:hypothetical protein